MNQRNYCPACGKPCAWGARCGCASGASGEMTRDETNREGLTFEEWIRATDFGTLFDDLFADWQAGVDPSELRDRPANPLGTHKKGVK